MGGGTKGCPEKKEWGIWGGAGKNGLSTTKVCGNDELIASSCENSDFRAEFSTVPPSCPSKPEFLKLKS